MSRLEGPRRCAGCVSDGIECEINLNAVGAWRRAVLSGHTFQQPPVDTVCTSCYLKDIRCILPETWDLRKMDHDQGGRKRQRDDEGGDGHRAKRAKDENETPLTATDVMLQSFQAILQTSNAMAAELRLIRMTCDRLHRLFDEFLAIQYNRPQEESTDSGSGGKYESADAEVVHEEEDAEGEFEGEVDSTAQAP